jgi:hypothetical protein
VSLLKSQTYTAHIEDGHLWVIISDTNNDGELLEVNITSTNNPDGTRRKYIDNSCIVNVGEHPWITHESFLYYRKARGTEQSAIDRLLQARLITSNENVSSRLLRKIQDGAKKSVYLETNLEKFFPYF